MKQRFEYKSIVLDRTADLSQYGDEGWELVGVAGQGLGTDTTAYYFKREKTIDEKAVTA